MFKSFSSGSFIRDEAAAEISSRSSALIVEYRLQCKRKSSDVSFSRPYLHIGSTGSLKPCPNLCSFKWLKFNLRRVNSLRLLLSCIAKSEFSLDLIKLRIISLNLFSDTMFQTFFSKCTQFLNTVQFKIFNPWKVSEALKANPIISWNNSFSF